MKFAAHFPVLKIPNLNLASLLYNNLLDKLIVKQMLKYLAFCGTPEADELIASIIVRSFV
jgi:hypothetical protein